MDIIQVDCLGRALSSTTTKHETILKVNPSNDVDHMCKVLESDLKKAKSPGEVIRLEKRLVARRLIKLQLYRLTMIKI